MESQNSQHVIKALEIADQLLAFANSEVVLAGDTNCSIIAAVMRDCAYKIKRHAVTKTKDGETLWKKQQSQGINLKKAMILVLVFALSFSAQVAQAAYVDVVDGLSPLGYWRLGEPSGTTATDRAGSYNGAYDGGVTLGATGAIGGDSDTAVSFNGTNGVVDVGPHADLLLTGSLSVSFWFNAASLPGTSATDPIFTLVADAPGSGTSKLAELAIDENGDIVYTHEYGDQGASEESYTFSTANLSEDTWYNIALIRDADSGTKEVYLYLDNSLLDTFEYTQQPDGNNEGTLHVGGYTGSYFEGVIDEFAIFNSKLTSQNVTDIYNAAQVPEPATIMILSLGAAVFIRRRK